jgi:recombinational DNA repair protein (RecF pathway)
MLQEFAREEVECERLFRLTLAVVRAAEKVPVKVLARYFEFWLLRFEGVLPALDQILPEELAVKTAAKLRIPPEELSAGDFTPEELGDLESAAEKLVECHLEKPLKARKMLKELL